MRFHPLFCALAMLICASAAIAALPPGSVTEVRLTAAEAHHGNLVLTCQHNGAYSPPAGPGLMTIWANGISSICRPGSQTFKIMIPAWTLAAGAADATHHVEISTHQAGTNAVNTFFFTLANLQSALDRDASKQRGE
jgi:hypothetical protein